MIAILIISFFVFLVLGMPIAFVMGSSASLAFLVEGISPIVLAQRTFTSTNSFALLAIPLFMLAGNLMERTEITKDLVNFCDKLVGHIRGGLAHTTCLTGMVFAAMCGSNNASAAAIGSMMIPALRDDGYDTPFAVSLVAAAGNLGPIIPPSIIRNIYGHWLYGIQLSLCQEIGHETSKESPIKRGMGCIQKSFFCSSYTAYYTFGYCDGYFYSD